jgi:hypothetical protein
MDFTILAYGQIDKRSLNKDIIALTDQHVLNRHGACVFGQHQRRGASSALEA